MTFSARIPMSGMGLQKMVLNTNDEQHGFLSFSTKLQVFFHGEMIPQNAQMAKGKTQEREFAMQ
jgi:hypothetical protein